MNQVQIAIFKANFGKLIAINCMLLQFYIWTKNLVRDTLKDTVTVMACSKHKKNSDISLYFI